jgi:Putative bacterial sensory transduction regulator
MIKQLQWAAPLAIAVLVLAVAAPAGAQTKDKIFRDLSPDNVESVLKEMGIKFKKTQPPKYPKDFDFDFERNNYDIRLTLRNGQLVWISAFFPALPLAKVNEWNQKAKFSRAVHDSIGGRDYAVVEYQIDAKGGVTNNMLKQLIRRFDDEVSRFDQFQRKE